MKRGVKPLKRSPLRRVSPKRASESRKRARVRVAVTTRDGGCRAAGWLAAVCAGVIDVHETATRARLPGSHLDTRWCIAVCRRHHDLIHDHPIEAAAAGFLVHSWQVTDDKD